jgi:hypothetical protein
MEIPVALQQLLSQLSPEQLQALTPEAIQGLLSQVMAGEQINVPTPAPLPMQQTGGIFSQPLGAMGNGSDGGLLEGAGAGVQQAASEVGGPSWFRETMQNNGFNANGLMQNTQLGQQLGAAIDKGKEGIKTMWQNSSIDANLAPAAVPEAMKNTLTAQSNLNLLATAGNVFGQDMMNDAMPELGHTNAAYIKPEFGRGYMAGAALKGAATGTTLGPVGTFMGAGIGMVKAGVQKDKLMNEWQEAYDERIANERLNNTNAARQMSDQVYSTYNTQGQFVSPMMEQGGPVGEEDTENKVAVADPALAMQYGPAFRAADAGSAQAPSGWNAAMDIIREHNMAPDGNIEDAVEILDPTGVASWDDAYRAYQAKEARYAAYPNMGESLDMLSALPAIGKMKLAMKYANPAMGPLYDVGRNVYNKFIQPGLSYLRHADDIVDTVGVNRLGGSTTMNQGGSIPMQPDYETEGGEVMLASPSDKPIALGQGNYKKMTDNLYKIEGPRHEGGGVPTAGAQQPFTDNLGNDHDSPYVFSDTEDFRFDASEILGML